MSLELFACGRPRELRPFWRYYGGKWRQAPRYPAPRHSTIVEPFAGAAGYSLRHAFSHRVILIEKYPTIAAIWQWLITADPAQIRAIPEVDNVDDLPDWVPPAARALVGFTMNAASSTPRRSLSKARRQVRAMNRQFEGWTPSIRERVASQVGHIRHWEVICGDYTCAPDIEATWFIDPPYVDAGRHYVHSKIDYATLAAWCLARQGQVIVCEANAASWLPFRPLYTTTSSMNGTISTELIWTGGADA